MPPRSKLKCKLDGVETRKINFWNRFCKDYRSKDAFKVVSLRYFWMQTCGEIQRFYTKTTEYKGGVR